MPLTGLTGGFILDLDLALSARHWLRSNLIVPFLKQQAMGSRKKKYGHGNHAAQ